MSRSDETAFCHDNPTSAGRAREEATDPGPLPPPPAIEPLTPLDEVATLDDPLFDLVPRAAEAQLFHAPREVPSAPVRRRLSPRPAPAMAEPPRVAWLVTGAGALVLAAIVCGHALVTPEPPIPPRAPVLTEDASATIECAAGAEVEQARPGTRAAYACRWGGRLRCAADRGCQVYSWYRDESLRGWVYVPRGAVLPLPGRGQGGGEVPVTVGAARVGIAEAEPTP